jgi:hypothetical protein
MLDSTSTLIIQAHIFEALTVLLLLFLALLLTRFQALRAVFNGLHDVFKVAEHANLSVFMESNKKKSSPHVLDWVSETWYGKQRCIIEVLDEDFVVDSRRHENYLECGVFSKQFLQLEKEEISIHGTFMHLFV